MAQAFSLQVDSAEFRRVMGTFDARFKRLARKRIRNAAKPVEAAIKAKVREGGPSKTGMREGIAAGVRTSISTGRRAGVSIVASTSKMPPGKKPMVKSWNKASYRHRVFGENVWVQQAGNPYFDTTIYHHRRDLERGVTQALNDTIREMERAR